MPSLSTLGHPCKYDYADVLAAVSSGDVVAAVDLQRITDETGKALEGLSTDYDHLPSGAFCESIHEIVVEAALERLTASVAGLKESMLAATAVEKMVVDSTADIRKSLTMLAEGVSEARAATANNTDKLAALGARVAALETQNAALVAWKDSLTSALAAASPPPAPGDSEPPLDPGFAPSVSAVGGELVLGVQPGRPWHARVNDGTLLTAAETRSLIQATLRGVVDGLE